MLTDNLVLLRMSARDESGHEHVIEHQLDPTFAYLTIWHAAYGSDGQYLPASTPEETERVREGKPAITHMDNRALWAQAERLIEATNRLRVLCGDLSPAIDAERTR